MSSLDVTNLSITFCTWSMWGCDQHSTHLRHDRVGVGTLGFNAKIVVTAVSTSYDSEEAEFTLANQTYNFKTFLSHTFSKRINCRYVQSMQLIR